MKTTRADPQPADFTDVRATNLAVVLRHLRANGPSSRAAIAASTGLNKATVSSLTGALLDQRLLRETGSSGNRIGRPGTALALDGSAYAAIGLQMTADRLTAVAVDFAGDQILLWHRHLDGAPATEAPPSHTPASASPASAPGAPASGGLAPGSRGGHATIRPGRMISALVALAQRAATRVRQQGRHVVGITVAAPGLISDDGTVQLSPSLGWENVDLRELLSGSLRRPGLDVTVTNHAGVAAIAELRHGDHAVKSDLTYVTGAAGVEAGIVVDGRLVHGSRGFTGQIGQFRLGPVGSPTLADLAGIEQLVRRALPGLTPAALTDLTPAVEQVANQARAGDPDTLAALQDTGCHLGQGLALLANLVNPEVIVLGDHYATLAEWILPSAEAELTRNTLAPSAGGTRLAASRLGLHAAALGGAVTHLDRIDTGALPAAAH
ncbi:transcriptional regulator [Actinoplanes philippinensis]|uniref:ROK family transcriptional regulator n=1 Tax=Actinoplanes philippinensis TaxID=35752 RepID=UPI000B83DD7F|nr:ROK family transcriptional regulator [Actinoplanes philippinensis]GIE81463.1 transcriptional regulator [Actinoplanes philippinensis]